MYKAFSLAIIVLHGMSQGLALASSPTAQDVTLQKFTTCAAMEATLKNIVSTPYPYYDITPTTSEGNEVGLDRGVVSGSMNKTDVSQTNIQTIGIDEADVVKTDGEYIYYVSNTPAEDGHQYITITRAIPVSNMSIVRKIKLPETYHSLQLYLANKRLTVVAQKWENPSDSLSWRDNSASVVIVYDVSKPETPYMIRSYTVSGSLMQSRRDGDYLYLVSQSSIPLYGRGYINPLGIAPESTEKISLTSLLPVSTDVRYSPSKIRKSPYITSKSTTNCSDIEYILPSNPQNLSFTTISVVPLGNTTRNVTRRVVYSDFSQLYMSEDNLYLVSHYWNQGSNFSCPPNARCALPIFRTENNSIIHRFQTGAGTIKHIYSVLMPGMPLSQYALHEKEGVLFTANQKDWSTNGVDIFAVGNDGKLLGKLENLGPGERFQSARYIGNRLYLVTFEQIDPLFVIDIKKPTALTVLGELKMPGYSTYLHPYDDKHLIGIGYDTRENTWGGTSNAGIKVDLYDVSDVSNPKQKFSEVYGGLGSASEALSNPRSLIWDSQKKVLIFPAQLMEQNQTTYEYTSAWQGILGVQIQPETGIKTYIKASHIDTSSLSSERQKECSQYKNPGNGKCYTHVVTGEKICPHTTTIPSYCYAEYDDSSYLAARIWEYSDRFIQRGVYIGDFFFALSPKMITAHRYAPDGSLLKTMINN